MHHIGNNFQEVFICVMTKIHTPLKFFFYTNPLSKYEIKNWQNRNFWPLRFPAVWCVYASIPFLTHAQSYTCTYVCLCMPANKHAHTHARTCTCMHIFVRLSVCVCACACVCVCVFTAYVISVCSYMYTCTSI